MNGKVSHVVTRKTNGSLIAGHQADHKVETRGLACAVWAEQANDFAGINVHRHTVYHAAAFVGFNQSRCRQDITHTHCPRAARWVGS